MKSLRDTIRQSESKYDPVLVACERTLSYVVKDYTQNLAIAIKTGFSNPDRKIEIEDVAPVCIYLDNFAQSIPKGSVYIGVTLLTSEQAWEGNDEYTEWGRVLRRRARDKEICVCRLWYLGGSLLTDALKEQIKAQQRDGIMVRVLAGDMSESPRLSDVSLVWVNQKGKVVNLDELARNPIEVLENNSYEPLSGLLFQVYTSSYLKCVTVLTRREIAWHARQFSESWRRGRLPNAQISVK